MRIRRWTTLYDYQNITEHSEDRLLSFSFLSKCFQLVKEKGKLGWLLVKYLSLMGYRWSLEFALDFIFSKCQKSIESVKVRMVITCNLVQQVFCEVEYVGKYISETKAT